MFARRMAQAQRGFTLDRDASAANEPPVAFADVRDDFRSIFGLLTRGGLIKILVTIGEQERPNCAGSRFTVVAATRCSEENPVAECIDPCRCRSRVVTSSDSVATVCTRAAAAA